MKQGITLKSLTPHLIAFFVFLAITVLYFQPVVLGNKQLRQGDVTNFKGMSKEIQDHRAQYHEEPLWTNRMFGGMPAFQISTLYPHNYIANISGIFSFGLPRPVYAILLAMLGFYLMLTLLKIDTWVAVFASVAYGLSSFIYTVIDAGHNPQAIAIAFMPWVFSGFVHIYRNKQFLTGAALIGLMLALELYSNHMQMTYYLFILIALYLVAEFVDALRRKELKDFFKASVFVLIASGLAVGANIGNLVCTADYGKYTTRGASELTAGPDGKTLTKEENTGGLPRDYVTAWSYRVDETFNLMIPNFKGGSSSPIGQYPYALDAVKDDNYKESIAKSSAYFGDQAITSGPSYMGAAICFLFVLALFFVEGTLKWALLAATALSIMLSWGYHFNLLSDFFIDHVPGYNKFRSVSFTLVIAGLAIPMLAALVLNKFVTDPGILKKNFGNTKFTNMRVLIVAFALTGGFCLVTWLAPAAFNTYFGRDELDYFEGVMKDPKQSDSAAAYMGELQAAREQIVKSDAGRSFIFIGLAALGLILYSRKTINRQVLLGSMVALTCIDMVVVDRRYLGSDSFEKKKPQNENPFAEQGRPSKADNMILQDKSPDYRVFNLTARPDQDAATSYFHNSLGGYHGAKLKRYQELIDFHISRSFYGLSQFLKSGANDSTLKIMLARQGVLNMLNTKYIIYNPDAAPIVNPYALGNAWFVGDVRMVANPDSEVVELGRINPALTAVVDQKFKSKVPASVKLDPTATIKLTEYKANHLSYHSKSSSDQLAIFSEIYYPSGWNAYIDGKLTDHFGADFVLRALVIPAGEHSVEFKFEPSYYYNSEKIAMICSILVIAGSLGIFIYSLRKQGTV